MTKRILFTTILVLIMTLFIVGIFVYPTVTLYILASTFLAMATCGVIMAIWYLSGIIFND